MAKGLSGLWREAMAAAKARGHRMVTVEPIRFRDHGDGSFTCTGQRMRCRACGMDVDTLLYPDANESSIAGEAVALNCLGRAETL